MTCSKPISDETQLKVDAVLLCDTVWKLLVKYWWRSGCFSEVHTYHAKKLKPSSCTCCRLYLTQGFRWKFQDKGTNLNFSLHQTCLEAKKKHVAVFKPKLQSSGFSRLSSSEPT